MKIHFLTSNADVLFPYTYNNILDALQAFGEVTVSNLNELNSQKRADQAREYEYAFVENSDCVVFLHSEDFTLGFLFGLAVQKKKKILILWEEMSFSPPVMFFGETGIWILAYKESAPEADTMSVQSCVENFFYALK